MEAWLEGRRPKSDIIGHLIDEDMRRIATEKEAALKKSRREKKLCIRCGGSLGFLGKMKKEELCGDCRGKG